MIDVRLSENFWIDRWMGSRGFLLPLEPRGLYREMLSQAWRRGAALPNDEDQIRRLVFASPEEWARAWPVVRPFWRVDGDALVNDTQRLIYAATQKKKTRMSTLGLAAARRRWG